MYINNKKYPTVPKKPKKAFIPKEEMDRLNKQSREEMLVTDPAQILNALGIDYKVLHNGTEYLFKDDGEDTPSVRFKLFNSGIWAWKSFRDTDEKGTIISLIQKFGKIPDYKDATLYYYNNMTGSRNYFIEALDSEIAFNYSFNIEEKQKEIDERRRQNKEKSSKYDATSRVTNAYLIYKTNDKAKEFLEKRGLDRIAPFLMTISGEYEVFKESYENGVLKEDIITKKQFGIGVLTDNIKEQIEAIKNKEPLAENIAGDIHYFKAFTTDDGSVRKTQSFGGKRFSYWHSDNNKNSDTVMIFESKFDASAAYCKNPNIWTDYNVVIANGVGTAKDIADFINKNNYTKIINYNQNDFAGYKFINDIVSDVKNFDKENNYTFISYKENEYKLDINDLYKNGDFSSDRFKASFSEYKKEFLANHRSSISLMKSKLDNTVSERIKNIDEGLVRRIEIERQKDSTKAITKIVEQINKTLSGDEKERFDSLVGVGVIKELNKYKIFKENLGKGKDSLALICEIKQKKKEIFEIINNFNTKRNSDMKIKTNEDLKNALKRINIKDFSEDEEFEAILDYLENEKKNAEVIRLINEWVKDTCHNNTFSDISKAKLGCFGSIEDVLDINLSYSGIGQNLVSKNEEKNEPTKEISEEKLEETEEVSFTGIVVSQDNFIEEINKEEIEDLGEDLEEKVQEKIINLDYGKEPKKEEPKKEEPKKEEPKKEEPKKEEPKKEEPKKEKKIDITLEIRDYNEKLNKINTELVEADKIKFKELNSMKKEMIEAHKDACNTIAMRIKEPIFTEQINLITNSQAKETLQKAVAQINNKCIVNLKKIKEIEISIDENIPNRKIDTANASSKEIVASLSAICSKATSISELLQKTALELKKNNEKIAQINNVYEQNGSSPNL